FRVTGTDWPTRDGSGVRDYVHVWDLADAHVRALERFDRVTADSSRMTVVNLGSGRGTTVWELVHTFENVLGEDVDVVAADRRTGDTAGAYASNDRALRLLGWVPTFTLEQGIEDTARWLAVRAHRLNSAPLSVSLVARPRR
ncbi:UDP-glucose 4-epimerase GalE, partial [Rhodococcus erythropolis]|nr:UDP-glucose 4-epimerase GalE [Rhodococcus erythropolis]